MCCNSWGRKESDTTERLNGTELNYRNVVGYKAYLQKLVAFLCIRNEKLEFKIILPFTLITPK